MKIGGSLFEKNLDKLYEDISALKNEGHEIVFIHGGGPQINKILERWNEKPRYIFSTSGMKSRYTDKLTLDAAIMALAGLINKKIVAKLQSYGINAFGMCGADGNLIPANRKKKIMSFNPKTNKRIMIRDDYSGKIKHDAVKASIIQMFLNNNFTPVIGALGIDDEYNILNIDGDRAAASICKAINADILISVTDVPGVYKNLESKDIYREIPREKLDKVLQEVEGGMKKKLIAVKEALSIGINKIIITSGLIEKGIFNAINGKTGTLFTP
ncbi:MAG: [LysW]-aminoadipate/[LysW]-glutamate kinase [Promethearchaeota archaeon]